MTKKLDDLPEPTHATPAGDAAPPSVEAERAEAIGRFADDLMAMRHGVQKKVRERLPKNLAVRVPVLIGLVVLLASWFQRHFQWPVEKMLASVMVILGSYSFLVPLAHRFVKRHRAHLEEGFTTVVVQYLGFLLRTPVLVTLLVITVVPNLFYSSVSVVAAGVTGEREIALYPQEESAERMDGELDGGEAVQTFRGFLTNPFGRPFILKVEGYQHRAFTLFPAYERQFRLSGLDLAPAVMLRVPPESFRQVDGDGEVRLFRRMEDGSLVLVGRRATREHSGAYVFGWYDSKEAEGLSSDWDQDLQASRELTIRDELENAESDSGNWNTIKWTWRKPVHASFLAGMEARPRQFLEAYYLRKAGDPESLKGRVGFDVTEEAVQDHLLLLVSDVDKEKLLEDTRLREALAAPYPGS